MVATRGKLALMGLTGASRRTNLDVFRETDAVKRRAFTLIELMVVLAVVAVLAALLLPSLSEARSHASVIQCTSNLRQIALAVQVYAEESNGRLPPRSRDSPWMSVLAPHYETTNILSCPTEWHQNRRTYAINGCSDWFEANLSPVQFSAFRLWQWPVGFPISAVIEPSETIVFGERLRSSGLVHVDHFQDGGNEIFEIDRRRHGKSSCFAFFDGSVRTLSEPSSLEPRNRWLIIRSQ